MKTNAAKVFGCTEAQAVVQMKKNLAQLERMKAKALATGRKVNCYTAEDLESIIVGVRKGWNL